MQISCKTGEGMEAWLDWLRGEVRREKQAGTMSSTGR